MKTLKFTVKKDSSRTAPILISGNRLRIRARGARLHNLAIILEDKGSRSVYFAKRAQQGFVKRDPLEFQKFWLEYNCADADYEVEALVG
jgi:hypothetical protein